MARPSWRHEMAVAGSGAASFDQRSIRSSCVSCLAIMLSSYRFWVQSELLGSCYLLGMPLCMPYCRTGSSVLTVPPVAVEEDQMRVQQPVADLVHPNEP